MFSGTYQMSSSSKGIWFFFYFSENVIAKRFSWLHLYGLVGKWMCVYVRDSFVCKWVFVAYGSSVVYLFIIVNWNRNRISFYCCYLSTRLLCLYYTCMPSCLLTKVKCICCSLYHYHLDFNI